MSDKKHIDRLFQERFKDFEAAPSDAVWERIEANLNKKKKRRVIPIWWRYAGVAASLLLLLTIGGLLFKSNEGTAPTQVVETEGTENPKTEEQTPDNLNNSSVVSNPVNEETPSNDQDEKPEATFKNVVPENETLVVENPGLKKVDDNNNNKSNKSYFNNNLNPGTIASNDIKKTQNSSNKPAEETLEKDTNKTLQNRSPITNPISKNTSIAQLQPKDTLSQDKAQHIADNKTDKKDLTIEDVLAKNKEDLEKENKGKRWSLIANAAPVYFNTLGQGSSIDPKFNNNSKSGEINMSYGLTASYALNDKIKIRSGINKVNLGYNTNDVVVFSTAGSGIRSSLQNVSESQPENIISDNADSNNISIVSQANLSAFPESFNSTNTTLNQAFGYIEVPLEIQYALINKKFGINLIGGFSSFFLNNNSIFSESENGSRIFLGEASNLNKISYSANFGLGLNYKFSEKIDLNLEPMFKYQINTFNNTSGNFTPFILGVYTGFAIKF